MVRWYLMTTFTIFLLILLSSDLWVNSWSHYVWLFFAWSSDQRVVWEVQSISIGVFQKTCYYPAFYSKFLLLLYTFCSLMTIDIPCVNVNNVYQEKSSSSLQTDFNIKTIFHRGYWGKSAVSKTCEEPVRAVWGTCEDIVSKKNKRFGDFFHDLSITIENLKEYSDIGNCANQNLSLSAHIKLM